jgi:hypothetical protein
LQPTAAAVFRRLSPGRRPQCHRSNTRRNALNTCLINRRPIDRPTFALIFYIFIHECCIVSIYPKYRGH